MAPDEELDNLANELQEKLFRDAAQTFSAKVLEHFNHPRNVGVIPKTHAFAMLKGVCGDTMEIFLKIEADVITEAKFNTDGCIATIACGSAITGLVTGKTVDEVFGLSAGQLLRELDGLPAGHKHCALLTVNTLYSAIGKYLVVKNGGEVL